MDFLLAQEETRRKVGSLAVLFVLGALGTAALVHVVAMWVCGVTLIGLTHWGYAPFTFGFAFVMMGVGTVFRMFSLQDGGSAVAREMGGRRVHPASPEAYEKRLVEVVEEVALAAGVPVPELWVLEREEGINAFVAGLDPASAVLGLTNGALRRLSTEELRALVIHEVVHIMNGDMRLNFRLLPWVHGLAFPVVTGRQLLGLRNGSTESSTLLRAFAMLLMLFGSIGSLFARMIQSSVSQARELEVDRVVNHMLRSPNALVAVLRKIGGWSTNSLVSSEYAPEVGHIFFSEAFSGPYVLFFPTHPPLEERIRASDTNWNREYLGADVQDLEQERGMNEMREVLARLEASEGGGSGEQQTPAFAENPAMTVRFPAEQHIPSNVLEDVTGRMNPSSFIHAGLVRRSLIPDWVLRTRSRENVKALMIQLFRAPHRAESRLGDAAPSQKMALFDMAMPLLRRMGYEDFATLYLRCERELARCDEVELFRFLLLRAFRRRMRVGLGIMEPSPALYHEPTDLWLELRTLISTMVVMGGPSAGYPHAYATSWEKLGADGAPPQMKIDGDAAALSRALEQIEQASPALKRRILLACGAAIGQGGYVTDYEACLIRLLADVMGVAIVPIFRSPEAVAEVEQPELISLGSAA
jgi:Zn-dependent protease with chaperone function